MVKISIRSSPILILIIMILISPCIITKEPKEEQMLRNRRENRLLHSHFSMTLRAPSDLEKLQRGGTAGRSALQMSHRTNPLFSRSTRSCRGATLQQRRPLFVFPLFHRDRQRDWGGEQGIVVLIQTHFTVRWENPCVRVCAALQSAGRWFSACQDNLYKSKGKKGVCGIVISGNRKRLKKLGVFLLAGNGPLRLKGFGYESGQKLGCLIAVNSADDWKHWEFNLQFNSALFIPVNPVVCSSLPRSADTHIIDRRK